MSFKPKAIVLDMDGTILNHKNQLSLNTKQIIDDLRKRGIYVFIATGRDMEQIAGVIPDDFQVDGIIASNGMTGYIGNKVVFQHSLRLELVEMVIEKARSKKIYYEVFPYGSPRITLKQDKPYVEYEIREPKPDSVGSNEWLSRKQAIKEKISWKDGIERAKFAKMYFFSRHKEQIDGWIDELNGIKQELCFSISSSTEHNVELMSANVNKATGIQQMLEGFGLSENETLAMGDSNNDLAMLEFVKYPVAMKNGTDQVKALANEVTEFTCNEEGVYHYLKKKFGL